MGVLAYGSVSRHVAQPTASTSFSFSITVPAGTDMLVVGYGGNSSTLSGQSVPTFNGTTMTLPSGGSGSGGAGVGAAWYYLASPSVGTYNVAVTNPANTNNGAWHWAAIENYDSGGSITAAGGFLYPVTSASPTVSPGANDHAFEICELLDVTSGTMTASSGSTAMDMLIGSANGTARRVSAVYRTGAQPGMQGFPASSQVAAITIVIPITSGGGGGSSIVPIASNSYRLRRAA